ncbi:hypothetical protein B0T26DRAFT_677239 [Lasiosphaeria miniovina]|uniref:F-box domain-containing protein n=1 Tax=Lasiosphaeria miniovina TaxID=1954250 RepID=A0AA40ABF9_9PEZI|nr:uncharacterized protein B0T26DRAFT_677239 [Lasiosphaeria miniovina]KAK0712827.1 hypothetical protein B0T26DRAFT_677239 [Lasiosphaeria miniovina]
MSSLLDYLTSRLTLGTARLASSKLRIQGSQDGGAKHARILGRSRVSRRALGSTRQRAIEDQDQGQPYACADPGSSRLVRLPAELTIYLLANLDPLELLPVSATCKHLRELSLGDSL